MELSALRGRSYIRKLKHVKRPQKVVLEYEILSGENEDEVRQQEAIRGERSVEEESSIEEVVTPRN
jgi:hypothetical protein